MLVPRRPFSGYLGKPSHTDCPLPERAGGASGRVVVRPKPRPRPKLDLNAHGLPTELPRLKMYLEPESTLCTTPGCGCQLKRIGEDVSEKLDYTPGVVTVERHIRGS